MNDNLKKRLKEIEVEDMVLGIFIVIIILAYTANKIEKNYFIKGLEIDKKKYYYLSIFIFSIVVIINIYFFKISYEDVVTITDDIPNNVKEYAYLTLLASILSLIAGIIILYIAISDTEIDAEITI